MLNNLQNKTNTFSLNSARQYISLCVEADLQELIKKNGHATLILTGGKSIVHFFSSIQKINISWVKIALILSDDRIVSSCNFNSNEKLINEKFLNKDVIKKNIDYFSIKEIFFNEAAEQYNKFSCALKNSIAILSMGLDGHVASLFTKDDVSDNRAFLKLISRPDYDRISLSYQSLLRVKKTYIIVYGKKKIDYLNRLNIGQFYLKDLVLRSIMIFVDDIDIS